MKIQLFDEPNTLRNPNIDIQTTEFNSVELLNKLNELANLAKNDGVAIAAPQAGWHVNALAIIVNKLLEEVKPVFFINPIIVKQYGNKIKESEGCISAPGLFLDIKRQSNLELKWQDETGRHFHDTFEGIFARILLHEIDHLKGVLFIDHASRSDRIKYDEWTKRRRINGKTLQNGGQNK